MVDKQKQVTEEEAVVGQHFSINSLIEWDIYRRPNLCTRVGDAATFERRTYHFGGSDNFRLR